MDFLGRFPGCLSWETQKNLENVGGFAGHSFIPVGKKTLFHQPRAHCGGTTYLDQLYLKQYLFISSVISIALCTNSMHDSNFNVKLLNGSRDCEHVICQRCCRNNPRDHLGLAGTK